MGNIELIESKVAKKLQKHTIVRRTGKRVYQIFSVLLNKDKFKAKGKIERVTPVDSYEYFYGYYDKSPWNADDRYIITLRVNDTSKDVAPNYRATLFVIDTLNNNEMIEIGTTNAWNVQQGCMAQWLGPDFSERIIYNDFRDNQFCSIIYNFKDRKVEKIYDKPVYSVSADGTYALSLDFTRLHRLRPGYGYSNIPDSTKDELCPNQTAIWKINLETGEICDLYKYTDFFNFEKKETMVGAEHKLNHIMISPDGLRFMVLHRWFKDGIKYTRLLTSDLYGNLYNLSDDDYSSHAFWKDNNHILCYLNKKETGKHYYLLEDQTAKYQMKWDSINTDGHCSYAPYGEWVVSDTYPNRRRIASVFLCSDSKNKYKIIAQFFSPFKYDFECRCDLHPRWNRQGNAICIDSVHEGKRGIYVIENVKEEMKNNEDWNYC